MTQTNQTNTAQDARSNPTNADFQCSEMQVQVWLRGLLTIAWADGDFDQTEQELVARLTQHTVTAEAQSQIFQPVTSDELRAAFEASSNLAEDFLRTAVMVAIADGVYTRAEDELLVEFCQVLGTGSDVLESLRHTLVNDAVDSAADGDSDNVPPAESMIAPDSLKSKTADPLQPVRSWLDGMQIQDPKVARFLCRMIPSQCPFERDVKLFGKKVVHIPPMCKLNPLYEQLVGLRFRALSYLADDCGEDVSAYF